VPCGARDGRRGTADTRFASLRAMSPTAPRTRTPWLPVAELPDSVLAPLAETEIGRGVRLAVEIGPKNHVGARYFQAFLTAEGLGRTGAPMLRGLYNRGPYPGFNWIEVTDYDGTPELEDGRELEIPEAIDLRIVGALGARVPAGGHLMMEYDSPARRSTALALAARVPPVATPLGAMMFAAGCGVAFRDWYISEGGREGPRKLQGFRAIDHEHERIRGERMLRELDEFMARSRHLDWTIQAQTRPLAQATFAALHQRLGLPEGPLAPSTG